MSRHFTRSLIDNGDGTHSVPLTRGLFSVIDSVDAELVAICNWHTHVVRGKAYANGYPVDRHRVSMHRWLFGQSVPVIDHRDGNGLNNRRSNLRPATMSQNNMNKRTVEGRIPFKGVYQTDGMFRARIRKNRTHIHLGRFPTAIEAAIAYDTAAVNLFGEFVATNKSLGLLGVSQ